MGGRRVARDGRAAGGRNAVSRRAGSCEGTGESACPGIEGRPRPGDGGHDAEAASGGERTRQPLFSCVLPRYRGRESEARRGPAPDPRPAAQRGEGSRPSRCRLDWGQRAADGNSSPIAPVLVALAVQALLLGFRLGGAVTAHLWDAGCCGQFVGHPRSGIEVADKPARRI